MKKGIKKHKMLLQGLLTIAILAVALFSVFTINNENVDAASFKYKDFDWETFQEENKTYWDSMCTEEEEEANEKCKKKILKAQEKFYKRLYKILAKYESYSIKPLRINDNIIIETVYYGLYVSDFVDPGQNENYEETWLTTNNGFEYDENLTEEDLEPEVKYTAEPDMQNYFAEEKDTLKTLIQNIIAYRTNCFGIYGDPTYVELEDGSKRPECYSGGYVRTVWHSGGMKEKCVDDRGSFELGFWEYYLSKYANDVKLGFFTKLYFLGLPSFDPYYATCQEVGASYPEGFYYEFTDYPEVSTNKYFDFLMYNKYYDNKTHLQKYFEEKVLDPAGVDCLTDKVCTNSLESAGLYETYEEEIQQVRKQINLDIISILEHYDPEINIEWEERPDYDTQYAVEQAQRNSYFWPIGSDETEVRNGITYADGEPASTEVISYFGTRTNPVTGVENEFHNGIDISGVDGTTNVIAVYTGEVITAVSSCSSGDTSCNEGYGNTIILSHSNGDYTVYAHLASIDSSVSVGATVQKGQLIGKVGSTGETNSSNLHYEIRVGGNTVWNTVDPLGLVSREDSRPQPSEGDFSVHETSLSRDEFIRLMVSYCNSGCSAGMRKFADNAGLIYDTSIASNVNPELVVVRAMAEGFSPGGSSNNYWGIRCYNGAGVSACSTYSSLAEGVRAFASVVSGYENASDMMSRYAYIGNYWFNPGSWSDGGCPYFPYIKKYMSGTRSGQVAIYCATGASFCGTGGGSGCKGTIDEDQKAYALWQVNDKMAPYRFNVFGL